MRIAENSNDYLSARLFTSFQRTLWLKTGWRAADVLLFSVLAVAGAAFILVRESRGSRRIPKALRQQVICERFDGERIEVGRDQYHIDHIVPHSRGGDTSLKNLRIVEKQRNLRRGSKVPRTRDFFQR